MKFAPNSLVLEILAICYGFTVSDPFPLTILLFKINMFRNLQNQFIEKSPDTRK